MESATCCGMESDLRYGYHQHEVLYIINAKHCISSSRRKIHANAWLDTAPKGLMICTALRAAMIYQAYGNPQSSLRSLRGTPTAAWIKKEVTFGRQKLLLFWWGMVDSDHRSQWQQIYSLPPLAAREIPHIRIGLLPYRMELVNGVEPSTCWLQISCSAIEPHQRTARIRGNEIYYTTRGFVCQAYFSKKIKNLFTYPIVTKYAGILVYNNGNKWKWGKKWGAQST